MEMQEKIFEGYDGMPWETTIEEFLQRNPKAEEMIDKKHNMENIKGFYLLTDFGMRFYYFYNGKMFSGTTLYDNPDATTISAIYSKIDELYGNCDKQEKYSADGENHFCVYKQVSPTFSIATDKSSEYDSFGRLCNSLLHITYVNSKILAEAEQFAVEQRKKHIEL